MRSTFYFRYDSKEKNSGDSGDFWFWFQMKMSKKLVKKMLESVFVVVED